MVGAIADWFAVTALFKHPLGLPIPHTALIPKRKDELGRSLEEFVGENFLQESIIRERIDAAHLSSRVGPVAHRRAQRPPGRGRGGQPAADRAHPGPRRGPRRSGGGGAAAAVPRGAGQPDRGQPARGGGPGRRAPRAGRPGARRGAPLAHPQREGLRRDRGGAGPVVVAERRQRPGHPPHPPRGGGVGRRHPARPLPPRPRRPGQRSRAARPGPAARRRDPGPDGAAQGPGAQPPAGAGDRDLAVERVPPRAPRVARRRRGAAASPRAGRAGRLRGPARPGRRPARAGWTATPPTSPCSWWAGTATS